MDLPFVLPLSFCRLSLHRFFLLYSSVFHGKKDLSASQENHPKQGDDPRAPQFQTTHRAVQSQRIFERRHREVPRRLPDARHQFLHAAFLRFQHLHRHEGPERRAGREPHRGSQLWRHPWGLCLRLFHGQLLRSCLLLYSPFLPHVERETDGGIQGQTVEVVLELLYLDDLVFSDFEFVL